MTCFHELRVLLQQLRRILQHARVIINKHNSCPQSRRVQPWGSFLWGKL